MQAQLDQLRAQLTTSEDTNVSAADDKALSGKMTKFSDLELQERDRGKALRARGRGGGDRPHDQRTQDALFARDRRPGDAAGIEISRSARSTSAWRFLASLIAWGAAVGAMAFVRNHMA